MKYYVIHDPSLTDRKKNLEKEFKKFDIHSVEWITTFPKEDLKKIKEVSGTYMPLGYVSCNMKHYDAMNRMVRDNVPEAIIFEDDVIISDFFNENKIPREIPYVKLGKGPPDVELPIGNSPIIFGNNGGSEAYYVKRMFARDFLNNLDLGWTIDVEIHAYLISCGIPLICVPMCYQEYKTSVNEDKKYPITWQQYMTNYQTSPKRSFDEWKLHV